LARSGYKFLLLRIEKEFKQNGVKNI